MTKEMKWVAIAVALVALIPRTTYVQSQCFTENDRFNLLVQTDLSKIADFGLDLLNQFLPLDPQENVFFSPYSIWSALALAYFGAEGETKNQLERALRAGNKIEVLRTCKALEFTYGLRQGVGPSYTFALVNRIYVDNRLPFRTCTKAVLRNEIQHIDFRDKSAALRTINGFVSDTTEGHIKDLLDQDALSDALLVIVNAAYFKGVWKTQFKPSQTQSATFTSGNSETKVKMMKLNTNLKYREDTELGIRLLELPYDGDAISMFLVLPTSPGESEFNEVAQNLGGSSLLQAMNNMTSVNVNLQLPKFTLETTLDDDLTEALENLGIVDLFNSTVGNLTRYVDGINLGVDKSVHKAFIQVAENGTIAAGATAFTINTRSGRPLNLVEFFCNRPFIFYLYDNDTDNILFLGAFRAPK